MPAIAASARGSMVAVILDISTLSQQSIIELCASEPFKKKCAIVNESIHSAQNEILASTQTSFINNAYPAFDTYSYQVQNINYEWLLRLNL